VLDRFRIATNVSDVSIPLRILAVAPDAVIQAAETPGLNGSSDVVC